MSPKVKSAAKSKNRSSPKKKATFPNSPKVSVCAICRTECPSRAKLRMHKRTHKNKSKNNSKIEEGEFRFTCLYCGNLYKKSCSLRRHERVHTGEKPLCCQECGKRFARSSTLQNHRRTHSGDRPFSCKTCHRTFAQQSTLYDHNKTHTGERPHQCEVCGKMFTKKNGLVRHLLIHSGEKPYKCSYCHKGFTQSNAVVEHERIHSGMKPFQCQHCELNFVQSNQLKSHMFSHAGVKDSRTTVRTKKMSNGLAVKEEPTNPENQPEKGLSKGSESTEWCEETAGKNTPRIRKRRSPQKTICPLAKGVAAVETVLTEEPQELSQPVVAGIANGEDPGTGSLVNMLLSEQIKKEDVQTVEFRVVNVPFEKLSN